MGAEDMLDADVGEACAAAGHRRCPTCAPAIADTAERTSRPFAEVLGLVEAAESLTLTKLVALSEQEPPRTRAERRRRDRQERRA